MGGDNFRKDGVSFDPNNQFLKLRQDFYDQETRLEEALWTKVTNQLNKINSLFGSLNIDISSLLSDQTDYEETIGKIILELRKSKYDCYLVPAPSSDQRTKTLYVSWDWNDIYSKSKSGNAKFSGVFGPTIKRYCDRRREIIETLKESISESIISIIQSNSAKKNNLMTEKGAANFTSTQLRDLNYVRPGYFFSDGNGYTVSVNRIRNEFQYLQIKHVPTGSTWPIFFDEIVPQDLHLSRNKLFYSFEGKVRYEDLNLRIDGDKPVNISPIESYDTLKISQGVNSIREVTSSSHGDDFVITIHGPTDELDVYRRPMNKLTQLYFKNSEESGYKIRNTQTSNLVFSNDGKSIILQQREYKRYEVNEEGEITGEPIVIGESSFPPIYSKSGKVYSANKLQGATILVDGKHVYTHIEGNNDPLAIDRVYHSDNTDSIYVSGSIRSNNTVADYFRGVLEDSGKIATTEISGNPSNNHTVYYYEGNIEVEEILDNLRKELEVAGIDVEFYTGGQVHLNWSW